MFRGRRAKAAPQVMRLELVLGHPHRLVVAEHVGIDAGAVRRRGIGAPGRVFLSERDGRERLFPLVADGDPRDPLPRADQRSRLFADHGQHVGHGGLGGHRQPRHVEILMPALAPPRLPGIAR